MSVCPTCVKENPEVTGDVGAKWWIPVSLQDHPGLKAPVALGKGDK